jgi:putative transposase
MVLDPVVRRWSSYGRNACGKHDSVVVSHPTYDQIAPDAAERQTGYRELVAQGIGNEELDSLRLYIQRQRALGSSRFQEQIERQLARRTGIEQPGRPRKPAPENVL